MRVTHFVGDDCPGGHMDDPVFSKSVMKRMAVQLHDYSYKNRASIEYSSVGTCGCFHCCEIFKSQDIVEWCDNDETALCPKCGIDSVLIQGPGLEISKEFLEIMHEEWFSS